MIVPIDLELVEDAEIVEARRQARGAVIWAERHREPGLERVARSLERSLTDELGRRLAGGRRGIILEVDALLDAAPDEAALGRQRAIALLGAIRDNDELHPAVRRIFAVVMAELAEWSPARRAVEEARLAGL